MSLFRIVVGLWALLLAPSSVANKIESLTVAVASNFVHPMAQLASKFEQEHKVRIEIISGSTGLLAAQIRRGAPVDVFFAADQQRPKQLAEHQLVETPETYAAGKLVLWWPGSKISDWQTFIAKPPKAIVIADPSLAPYGVAARQVLVNTLIASDKQVLANNINQAFQYVDSGNIEAGLLAQSSLLLAMKKFGDQRYKATVVVPPQLYEPILQDVAVVKRSKKLPLARRFVDYILAPQQQQQIVSLGYQAMERVDG